jgi:hypothetical protein
MTLVPQRLAGAILLALAGAVGAVVLRRRRTGRDGSEGAREAHQPLTCACGAEYHVVGTGRHQVIWPAGEDQKNALMSSECPSCGRPLEA